MQEIGLRDGVPPVAAHEAGGDVHEVGQLRAAVALRLKGQLPQVDVVGARPVLQVHLRQSSADR